MALNLPNSPTNGQIFSSGTKKWTWSTAEGSWLASNYAPSPENVNGIVKCNGAGNFSAAAAGTDYLTSATLGSSPATAKAWVNFNGITGAMRASFNVSSITRNGTANTDGSGDITISFTNPMADTNYVVLCNGTSEGGDAAYGTYAIRAASMSSSPTLMTASQVRIVMGGKVNAASNYNMFTTTVAIFGN
jgi:hypothetical protein